MFSEVRITFSHYKIKHFFIFHRMTEKPDEIIPIVSNNKMQEVTEDAEKKKLSTEGNGDKSNRLVSVNSNGNTIANDNINCYW